MTKYLKENWVRKLLIVPPFLIGVGLVLAASLVKKPPKKIKIEEKPISVRVISITKTSVVPKTRGYGVVRPARVWQGVAKVTGPVALLHSNLQAGAIIKKNEQLIAIDPSEYQLALEQIDAELAASTVKVTNTNQLLKIEKRNAALLNDDLKRQLTLKKRGATTQVSVDAASRAVLSAQAKVQGLKNTITQLGAEQKVLAIKRANAALDLQRTVIKAPFDLRISEVLSEKTQYANKGQVLVKADGIKAMEVTAHIPMGRLRFLVRGTGGAGWLLGTAEGKLSGPLKLKAKALSRRPHGTVSWPARVSRITQNLDPQTQTVGIVVTIDDPYGKAIPGIRPILVPNTFVEVELYGKAMEEQIIIPASALHQGHVYVMDADKRLVIRRVKVKFRQGSFAVIADGLEEGERLILTDLIPAIKGMLLKPKGDKKALQNLLLEAKGEKPAMIKGK